MPRTPRLIVPGIAHHVTQRGNRRQQTFFSDKDYRRYVELLVDYGRANSVRILAWCLMPNHVHLVAIPSDTQGLQAALALVHQRYTWLINRRNGWSGHLWQSRFHSCPLDGAHLREAVRYVELNPVRAGLVTSPEQWRWSSAGARAGGAPDDLLDDERPVALKDIDDWLTFLAEGLRNEEVEQIRKHVTQGRALGSDDFIARVEAALGRSLHRRPGGRPRERPPPNRNAPH